MADQTLKWWHVRWRLAGRAIYRFATLFGKIIGLLCLVAAIGYSVFYLVEPWLVSQNMCKVDPRLSIIPVDLPTEAEAPLSSSTIDCYGFRVSLPNEKTAKTMQDKLTTLVLFRNGGILKINNTSEDSGILESAISDKHAEKLVGPEIFHSKFKLMQAAMWATPGQTKWWKFRTLENERVEYLLLTKFLVLAEVAPSYPSALGPIYTISAGRFRGFQIGNTDVSPYEAHLDLFDGADRHFAFDVSGPEGHKQVLTQAEVNAVVASIRPISDH